MRTSQNSPTYPFSNIFKKALAIGIVASLLPVSKAFADETEIFGMVASVGAEINDQDIILSRRVDQTITFKYCSAVRKDGTQTKVAEFRKRRFKKVNFETDPASFQSFKKELFESKDVCEVIGKPLYGINKEILYNNQYVRSELWNSGDRTVYWWGIGIGSGTFLVSGFKAVGSYLSDVNASNTSSFFKRFSSNGQLRFRSSASVIGLLVAGGFVYTDINSIKVYESLLELAALTEKIDENKAKITETSMPEMKKAFELAISVATKKRTLIEL